LPATRDASCQLTRRAPQWQPVQPCTSPPSLPCFSSVRC
jgi:hypothetical protein